MFKIYYEVYLGYRSSHRRCSVTKGALKIFSKFIGKHLCQSLFFNKVAGATVIFVRVVMPNENLDSLLWCTISVKIIYYKYKVELLKILH